MLPLPLLAETAAMPVSDRVYSARVGSATPIIDESKENNNNLKKVKKKEKKPYKGMGSFTRIQVYSSVSVTTLAGADHGSVRCRYA